MKTDAKRWVEIIALEQTDRYRPQREHGEMSERDKV
jgi:hypothetical protein